MKKTVALLLTFIVCFSLCACGKASKEELLKSAEEVSASRLHDELGENIVKVKEQYVGKSYKVTGCVYDITEDYVILEGNSDNTLAYLSSDELSKLEKDAYITVVGEFDSIEPSKVHGSSITMKNAYLVTDEFEIKGEISQTGRDDIIKHKRYVVVNTTFAGDKAKIRVYLTDANEYQKGDLIKVKGKISSGDYIINEKYPIMEDPQILE